MIKELPLNTAANEDSTIQHLQAHREEPHIVEVYGVYIQHKARHLMMPIYEGDLRKLLKEDKQAEHFSSRERYLSEMLNIAKALSSVHSFGMEYPLYCETGVHHDVKPDNIFLHQGSFILSDFGIVTVRSPTISPAQDSHGNLTWYSAPETQWGKLWRGEAGPKSDVFSLGCVFLELLVHMKGNATAVIDFCNRRKPDQQLSAAPFWIEGERRLSPAVETELNVIQKDHESPKRARYGNVVREMLEVDVEKRLSIEKVVDKLQKIQGTVDVVPPPVNAANDEYLDEAPHYREYSLKQSTEGGFAQLEKAPVHSAESPSANGWFHSS